MGYVRNLYHRLLLVPRMSDLFRPARPNCATIFMLHRFLDNERGIYGLDPEILRNSLTYLRKNNYEFLTLSALFNRLACDSPQLRSSVVFTLDDGYIDQVEIAGPVFAEFDCPATIFVTTGFLDRQLWMWWDKVEFIFSNTRKRLLCVTIDDKTFQYGWSNEFEQAAAKALFIDQCKVLIDSDRYNSIIDLAENAEVDLPQNPPAKYEPITWDIARSWESSCFNFGAHTVTHPILGLITAEQSSWEIIESWHRLCEEVHHPTPVFCYPNGQISDYGTRETGIIRNAGLLGAVTGAPGFADRRSFLRGDDGPFRIGRLAFPESLSDLVQYVSGIERYKQLFRTSI